MVCRLQDVDKLQAAMEADPQETRRIVITTYDCAQKLRGYEEFFGMLICDESQRLKNPEAQRTQFFNDLVKRGTVRRLIFLSGTPTMSRPVELYMQVQLRIASRTFARLSAALNSCRPQRRRWLPRAVLSIDSDAAAASCSLARLPSPVPLSRPLEIGLLRAFVLRFCNGPERAPGWMCRWRCCGRGCWEQRMSLGIATAGPRLRCLAAR